MGQGSSQPQDGELPELEGHAGDAMLQEIMGSVTVAKKGKSKVQVEGTPAPKRKRKSSLNNTSDGKASTLSTMSQLSPQSPAVSHHSKRTKLALSGVSTKNARKLEKKSPQEAILSPELPNGVKSMENETRLPQIPNAQPPASTVHTNGAVKKIKKSKAKSVQKSEKEESLAPSPTAIESKTPITTLESADQSAMDISSDQKDQIDPSDAVRGPRPGKKAKLVGFFAPAEVRALEEFKLDFCTRNALSSDSFDQMVQHVDRRKDSGWPCDEAVANKTEFWQAIYDVLPGRDRRSVYRFMRRHFQDSSQKPHHWTHDQDEELIRMVGQYGPKFAHIAKMLGRGEDDVVQRWKNRLEHRSTMRRGAWSQEEVRGLLDALQSAWVALKKDGKDVGLDIYEMDEGLISWGQVSNKLDNWRSRQQCADKWRKIRRKIMGLRSSGVKDAVFDPASEARPQGRAKSITLAEQMELEKVYKSAEYVNSDDGNESEADSLGANESQASKQAQKQNTCPEPAESKAHSLSVLPKPTAIPEKAPKHDSSSESESVTSSSDDGSESEPEIKADSSSGSGSSAGPNSDDEMNGKVDPRIIAQDKKLKSKSMKDQQNTPNKKPNSVAQAQTNDKQTAKSIETLKAQDQALKKYDSNPSAYVIESNATAHGKASEQQKSLGQKKKVPHEASSESESGSSSESADSDSDSNSSAETDSDSASDSEISPVQKISEPSAKNAEKKTPTITQKANGKLKGSQRSEKSHRNTQSSAETSSASSEDGSTEDSADSGDKTDDSDNEGSVDVATKPLKAASAKDPKRKIQSTTQAPEKRDIKRLKTDSKSSRDSSSSSSSSATSSAADSESKSGDSEDDASQESDTSSSESNGSRSESESESKSESESELELKVHSKTRPNGQKLQPASGAKERSDLKSGKSVAPKSKPKSTQPSSPIVKGVGAKTKGKSRLVSSTKKKASK